jgi:flagellar motor switch protein FliN/FliY
VDTITTIRHDGVADLERVADAVNRGVALLAIDGRIAGPAAPQDDVGHLLPSTDSRGHQAVLADGTVLVALAPPDAVTDDSLLIAALETVAGSLGLTLPTPHEVEAASVGGGLVDSRVTVVGAGVFEGEQVVASIGAMVPEPRAAEPAATTPRSTAPRGSENLHLLADVELQVSAELGRTSMTMGHLLDLQPGSVIELDRAVGSPIDVLVNGTLIARGEIIVVEDRYAVRVTEIVADGEAR